MERACFPGAGAKSLKTDGLSAAVAAQHDKEAPRDASQHPVHAAALTPPITRTQAHVDGWPDNSSPLEIAQIARDGRPKDEMDTRWTLWKRKISSSALCLSIVPP
jgi:hypothetical protein